MINSPLTLALIEDAVDSESVLRRTVAKFCPSCEVYVIRHGGEAIGLLLTRDEGTPSLIVLDSPPAGNNGPDILRELRRNERTRQLPIVMLSALESNRETWV